MTVAIIIAYEKRTESSPFIISTISYGHRSTYDISRGVVIVRRRSLRLLVWPTTTHRRHSWFLCVLEKGHCVSPTARKPLLLLYFIDHVHIHVYYNSFFLSLWYTAYAPADPDTVRVTAMTTTNLRRLHFRRRKNINRRNNK